MPGRKKTDWLQDERYYEEHSAITWPTNITPELLERLKASASTKGALAAIATEIYDVGEEFYQGHLDKPANGASSSSASDDSTLGILQRVEAAGYKRVGSELLYFQEPDGSYRLLADETLEAAFGKKGFLIELKNTIDDLIIPENPKYEGIVMVGEVSKRVKANQIEARKVELLRQHLNGFFLLDDLLKDAERMDPQFQFRYYGLRGIKAGIERYKQLYQALTSQAKS